MQSSTHSTQHSSLSTIFMPAPAHQANTKKEQSYDDDADAQHEQTFMQEDVGHGQGIEQAAHARHRPPGSYPRLGPSHFSTSASATPFRFA